MNLVLTAAFTFVFFSCLEHVNCQGRRKIISQFQDKLAFLGTSNICVIEERIIDLLSV